MSTSDRLAEAVLEAIRNETVVIGTTDDGESVLLVIELTPEGEPTYLPVAKVLLPAIRPREAAVA